MTAPSVLPAVTLYGGPSAPATVLGQSPARIPTAGKIRAGIKVLSKRAAGEPRACEIYERGLRDGHSFDRIEQALADALPQWKNPLVPRNVPWFTVRGDAELVKTGSPDAYQCPSLHQAAPDGFGAQALGGGPGRVARRACRGDGLRSQ